MGGENMCQKSIIVFDSGFGGISVLKRLVEAMPNENYLYYGDSANAPYGPRSKNEIQKLTLNAITQAKKRCEPKAIVIACNTATANAKDFLQLSCPDIPVFGILPAVKSAAISKKSSRVLVLATAGTLASKAYENILSEIDSSAEIVSVAAPEIVHYVEGGMSERKTLIDSLTKTLAPYMSQKFDCVVLGCTHFPFAADVIEEVLGYSVSFFDGSVLTTKQVKEALENHHTRSTQSDSGSIQFVNSANQQEYIKFSWKLFSSDLKF
jgi:glutamate racemase